MNTATATSPVPTRLRFRHVLFATDFSPAARRAVPFAKAISRHYDADLVALHVRGPMVNPLTQPTAWEAVLEAERERDEVRRRELIAEFEGLPARAVVEEGDILSRVQSVIRDNRIDLLVIGTHGRTGLGKFILGSVAEELFRTVRCPVLTVGPHANAPAGREARFREILYATDLSPESKQAAAHAVSLAQEFQARLVLLHVIPDPQAGDLVLPGELTASSMNLLHSLLPEGSEFWCKPEWIVAHGNTADVILEIAKQRESDLIVLGVRPEAGAPVTSTHLPITTAHKVVAHAACPVLTVRH